MQLSFHQLMCKYYLKRIKSNFEVRNPYYYSVRQRLCSREVLRVIVRDNELLRENMPPAQSKITTTKK